MGRLLNDIDICVWLDQLRRPEVIAPICDLPSKVLRFPPLSVGGADEVGAILVEIGGIRLLSCPTVRAVDR